VKSEREFKTLFPMFMVVISIDLHTFEISVGLYYELPNNDVYNQIELRRFHQYCVSTRGHAILAP
jgi:hypothetical protein